MAPLKERKEDISMRFSKIVFFYKVHFIHVIKFAWTFEFDLSVDNLLYFKLETQKHSYYVYISSTSMIFWASSFFKWEWRRVHFLSNGTPLGRWHCRHRGILPADNLWIVTCLWTTSGYIICDNAWMVVVVHLMVSRCWFSWRWPINRWSMNDGWIICWWCAEGIYWSYSDVDL